MFAPERKRGDWSNEHQFLYSLLWSSFLDLDAYSASRFRRRFFPYSTEFVVLELLRDVPQVAALSDDAFPSRSRRGDDTGLRLSPPFLDLALWTVVPRLFGASVRESKARPRRERRGRDDFDWLVEPLRNVVAGQLRDRLDIDVAAFRLDADERPPLPPGLFLGIEDAALRVDAGRRRATATLSAAVNIHYSPNAAVAEIIDPANWSVFGYWEPYREASVRPLREVRQPGRDGTIDMSIVLPGGNRATPSKWRRLQTEYSATAGAFGARVDFEAFEIDSPRDSDRGAVQFEAKRASDTSVGEEAREGWQYAAEEQEHYVAPYSGEASHVELLRGYLALDKIEGRPGWTRFTVEREARFESPNHDRFRVETLMFWLLCDLLSFARTYREADRR